MIYLEGKRELSYICTGKKIHVQGNGSVPLFFWYKSGIYEAETRRMNTEVHNKITSFIDEQLEDTDVFLVEVKILPGNNIRIFLDADSGVTIDKCIKVNRALYRHLEETGLFPNNDFALEVSSPGVDEPLRLHRQYTKNIGRIVEVTMMDASKKEGRLIAVGDDDVSLEETAGKGKQKSTITHSILFNQIKHTKVLVTF